MTGADIEIGSLLQTIYDSLHYDFRSYAMASLRRRVERALARLGCATVAELEALILRDPRAFGVLLEHLTVQVSEMFRDPPFFRVFRERVVPALRAHPAVRLWIAGCSTGEEAYSFAIVLAEEGLLDRALIYATDINPSALERAIAGVYDVARVGAFTEQHRLSGARGSLSDHYTAAYGGAVFDRSLRAHILFSDHSLATDHVFAEVQVVSCRNVLIYFDRALRDRALGLFQEALSDDGRLGIGARETLDGSSHAASFAAIAGGEGWYRAIRPR